MNHLFWFWNWFCLRSCWRACRSDQFSEWNFERFYSAHATQLKVAILEFESAWTLRSALLAHDLIRHGLQRVAPFDRFVSNVEAYPFMTRTCLATIWQIFCGCLNKGLLRSIMCLFNVGILTFFRWACLDYTRFNNGSPCSLWRSRFFE